MTGPTRALSASLAVAILAFGSGYGAAQTPNGQRLADTGRVEIRAQLSARTETMLSAEITARILQLPKREGEAFAADEVLVALDCASYEASLGKAEAQRQAKQKTLAVNRGLDRLGAISTLEVDVAAAELKVAEADVTLARIAVDRCTIRAPFAGRVAEAVAQPWQTVAPGDELIRILNTQDLEAEMLVPSRWLSWLEPGTRLQLTLDELDRSVTAEVSRWGAAIDPVSQSINLFARIVDPSPDLLPGMSGRAVFGDPTGVDRPS